MTHQYIIIVFSFLCRDCVKFFILLEEDVVYDNTVLYILLIHSKYSRGKTKNYPCKEGIKRVY